MTTQAEALKIRRAYENIRNNYVGWRDNVNFEVLEKALAALASIAAQPVDRKTSDKWSTLFVAASNLIAHTNPVHGYITFGKNTIQPLTDALHDIDGGKVSKRAAELHEKAFMPLDQATALALREYVDAPAPDVRPIDMILHCPKCGRQHIDAPEWERDPHDMEQGQIQKWKNPPHRSHLCRPEDGGCGHIWRPADVPTNGVSAIQTKGKADSPARDVRPSVPEQQIDQYARDLAMNVWRAHYRDDSPYFGLLDTTLGVLSQLDNMVSGLARKTAPSVPVSDARLVRELRTVSERLKSWADDAQVLDGLSQTPDIMRAASKTVEKAVALLSAQASVQGVSEELRACEAYGLTSETVANLARPNINVDDGTMLVNWLGFAAGISKHVQSYIASQQAAQPQEPVGEVILFGGDCKEVSWRKGLMPPPGTKLYAAPVAAQRQDPLCRYPLCQSEAEQDRVATEVHAALYSGEVQDKPQEAGKVEQLEQEIAALSAQNERFADEIERLMAAPSVPDGYKRIKLSDLVEWRNRGMERTMGLGDRVYCQCCGNPATTARDICGFVICIPCVKEVDRIAAAPLRRSIAWTAPPLLHQPHPRSRHDGAS